DHWPRISMISFSPDLIAVDDLLDIARARQYSWRFQRPVKGPWCLQHYHSNLQPIRAIRGPMMVLGRRNARELCWTSEATLLFNRLKMSANAEARVFAIFNLFSIRRSITVTSGVRFDEVGSTCTV